MKKRFYEMTEEEVFNTLQTSEKGLTQTEAEERLQIHGENILKEKNKKSPLKIFFRQFSNMMVLLLILVGIPQLPMPMFSFLSTPQFLGHK